jgi:hypothetical protein
VPAHLGEEELQRVDAGRAGGLEERLVELERLVGLLLEVVLEQQVKVMVLQKSGDGTFLSFVCWPGASSRILGGAALEAARLHPLQRSPRPWDSRFGEPQKGVSGLTVAGDGEPGGKAAFTLVRKTLTP